MQYTVLVSGHVPLEVSIVLAGGECEEEEEEEGKHFLDDHLQMLFDRS